jgi:hypothetical protein
MKRFIILFATIGLSFAAQACTGSDTSTTGQLVTCTGSGSARQCAPASEADEEGDLPPGTCIDVDEDGDGTAHDEGDDDGDHDGVSTADDSDDDDDGVVDDQDTDDDDDGIDDSQDCDEQDGDDGEHEDGTDDDGSDDDTAEDGGDGPVTPVPPGA